MGKSKQLSYTCAVGHGPILYKTLSQVLEEAAEKWPEEIFIVSMHQGLEKTFRQVNEDSNRLAAALLSIGVKKGDRVGIWSPNCYEWVVTQFGTAKIGAILVNMNPAYRVNEFVYCSNLVGLSTLIAYQKLRTSNYIDLLEAASPGIFDSSVTGIGVTSKTIPTLKNVIFIDNPGDEIAPASITRFAKFIDGQSTDEPTFDWNLDAEDIINIQYTSGTTGNPKGASLTHLCVINNASYGLYGYLNKKVVCVPNPLYHCFGSVAGTTAGVVFGNKVVLPSAGFSSSTALAAIEMYKCDTIFGTPTMFVDFMREYRDHEMKTGKKIDISSVQTCCMGGAPCA